jgi:hypothetical protein
MFVGVRFKVAFDFFPQLAQYAYKGVDFGLFLTAKKMISVSQTAMRSSVPSGRLYRNLVAKDEYGIPHFFPEHRASARGQPPAILTGWLYRSAFHGKARELTYAFGYSAPHAPRLEMELGRPLIRPLLWHPLAKRGLLKELHENIWNRAYVY